MNIDIIPLIDGFTAWILTWVEAKKAKQSEIVNQININMRQAATSAETDSPRRAIGFCAPEPEDYEEEEVSEEAEAETVNGFDADLSAMLDKVEEESFVKEEEIYVAPVAAPVKTEMAVNTSKRVMDETSVITESMIINGNIATEGGLDIRGSIVGNVEALGKLNINGVIQGNSQAAEIFAENAKITGELRSSGSIKVGQSTVIIGNVSSTSAVVAGAVTGGGLTLIANAPNPAGQSILQKFFKNNIAFTIQCSIGNSLCKAFA